MIISKGTGLKTLLTAGLFAASSAMALAQSSPPIAANHAAIVEAANKEGSVTWYTNPGYRKALEEPLAEFAKQYPKIEVKIVEATGPDVMERVRAERRAGRLVADLVTAGDSVAYLMVQDGAMQPLDLTKVPNAANMIPRLKAFTDPGGHVVPTTLFIYGIGVNTRALPEAEYPKKWTDLADARFAGKVAVHDISRLGGGNALLTIGLEPLGRPFFESLMQRSPRIFARPQEMESALVRGERAIAIPLRTRTVKLLEGAPIKFIAPEDGVFFVVMETGVLAGSQHPNAAYVFLNFLLGKGAQEQFGIVGDGPVIRGVTSLVNLETANFLGAGVVRISDLPRLKEIQGIGQTLVQSMR